MSFSENLESPPKLHKLATRTLAFLLQKAVKNMNAIIAADLKSHQKPKKGPQTSSTNMGPAISVQTCAKAALEMMKVRKYIMSTNTSSSYYNLTPEVAHNLITTAITLRNIGIIRLVVSEWNTNLDFRALDNFQERKPFNPTATNARVSPMASGTALTTSFETSPTNFFLPPNEFDWFAKDCLGSILKMSETCEIFSIIGMSQCSPNLQELHLNSRRREYWACPPDIMELVGDVLSQMNKLTVLTLRGMCDDYILQLVGKTATGLKRFDLSGSHFVTDSGLKSLFFKDVNENPATYLMKSFIEKNLRKMNPLVKSLEMLDYSWTNVSVRGRQMISNLPQAYIFKRVFALSEHFGYGHHIFIRKKILFQGRIPSLKDNISAIHYFEQEMEPYLNQRGVKSFLKFAENHPWKKCLFHFFKDNNGESTMSTSNEQQNEAKTTIAYRGIIVPNDEEKRVYGIVKFQDGTITEIYSVFPININILGETCPKLQLLEASVTDVWKTNSSILTELTALSMFADPLTTKNVLEFVPNLRKIKIRIKEQLTDDFIINSLASFMCCRTLEELWIAPGSYKEGSTVEIANIDEVKSENYGDAWRSFNQVQENYYAAENPPRKFKSDGNENTNSDKEESKIEDLVHLTAHCLKTLLAACKKLKRVGDLAWWTIVGEDELEIIHKEMLMERRDVTFIWENQTFPKNRKL